MTAKHRKGKGNQKHEDNFFKNEIMESEIRTGGNNYTLVVVLLLMFVIGGATGAWFCFQQHQTLTYLTDSLMGLQMKIMTLQSSHEEMRQSSSKQHIAESLESRLNALEESYALAQKQVGMAMATAEQLKTSDLPAQVLSLHTEMKAHLAEIQQATVSLEQLSQLKEKSEEFDGVKIQIEGLATLSAELSQRVELLTGSQAETESKLEERFGQVTTLSNALEGQAADVLTLKEQLDAYQAQLEASTLETAAVRELLENELSQRLHQPNLEEHLNMLHQSLQDQNAAANNLHSELRAQLENVQKQVTQLLGETQPPGETVEKADEETVATAQEQSAAAYEEEKEGLKKEAFNPEEEAAQRESPAQDEAPVEQEVTVTEDPAPAEEVEAVKEVQTEQYGSLAKPAKEEIESWQPRDKGQSVEEDVPIEKNLKVGEEEKSEGQQVEEESLVESESYKAEREKLMEREQGRKDNHKAEEERVSEKEETEEERVSEREETEDSHKAEEERVSEREETEEDSHKAEEERVSEREEVDNALASEGEKVLEKLLQEEKLNVDEVAEGQEEQEDVAAEVEIDDADKEEEPLANYSLPEDKCK